MFVFNGSYSEKHLLPFSAAETGKCNVDQLSECIQEMEASVPLHLFFFYTLIVKRQWCCWVLVMPPVFFLIWVFKILRQKQQVCPLTLDNQINFNAQIDPGINPWDNWPRLGHCPFSGPLGHWSRQGNLVICYLQIQEEAKRGPVLSSAAKQKETVESAPKEEEPPPPLGPRALC